MTTTGERIDRYLVEKMDCPTEEKMIRAALERVDRIASIEINLVNKQLTVRHGLSSDEPIVAALERIGMGPQHLEAGGGEAKVDRATRSSNLWRQHGLLALSGTAALGAELLAYATGKERSLAVVALSVGSIVLGGREPFVKGLRALRSRSLNMNVLMTVAVIGAAIIGQWPEAAMVTFLFGLAEAIEAHSLDRARNAIRELLEIAPPAAFVMRDGRFVEVPVERVLVGETVRVRPGESIPMDGTIVRGSSAVNQAPITGESMPVDKAAGEQVFAGSLNGEGALEIRVTAIAGDSTLARIARSIQEAQSQRAPTQRFVDRFASYYTPAIMLTAIVIAIVPPALFDADARTWVYRGLVLLVIGCPCALVISTPVSVVSGLASAAKRGILIKGGVYLEEARKLRAIAVDKTGTLTHGHPAVTDVVPLGSEAPEEILRIAASLEASSDHPVARAVTSHWTKNSHGDLENVDAFRSITGRGVAGRVRDEMFYLGSHRLVRERGATTPELEALLSKHEAEGKTMMVLLDERGARGVIAVADTVRTTSRDAVQALAARRVTTVMLTGDNGATARSVAGHVGIDDVRADLMPEDKVKAVEGLVTTHRHVAMIGDGVNDAPALARASIGIAMGAAGTDTAIETADVALMQDDLRKAVELIDLSKQTGRVLVQNIALSLGIKLIFFALALGGVATLWMAVFADMGASLIVVLNGLRLLRPPASGHEAEAAK